MENTYYTSFVKFKNGLSKKLPGFDIKYKNESLFMKILGILLFFNSDFMTSYITTIGKTVYFPDKNKIKNMSGYENFAILAHEYQHAKDSYGLLKSFWFGLSYLFPQILFILFFILMIISIWFSWVYFGIFLTLTLISLLPFPAPGRKHWELKGYIMSLFFANEIHKMKWGNSNLTVRNDIINSLIIYYDKQFTTSSYYFMWPFGVKKDLIKAKNNIISNKILTKDPIYNEVSKIFLNS